MKDTRRMKRMARSRHNRVVSLSLTSLMDVFTILVLYLLVNQSAGTVLEPPKNIKLPDSVVMVKPRDTLVVTVSNDEGSVQGVVVATVADVMASEDDVIEAIRERMVQIKGSGIGINEESESNRAEVTVMGHRTVHFKVLKRVMASCTAAGFTKVSLAVNQK